MIRPKWAIVNMWVCFLLALAIVSPVILYIVKLFLEAVQPPIYAMVPIMGS